MTETPVSSASPAGAGLVPPRRSDLGFWILIGLAAGLYALLILLMIGANTVWVLAEPGHALATVLSPELRHATLLSLLTATAAAVFALWVAVPTGWLLARAQFPGRRLLDAVLDIPIVLPPMVVGLCLLILFSAPPLRFFETEILPISYAVPGIILAQFAVAAAFAIRSMRATFDQISPRPEQVALTLGCSRWQAFSRVGAPAAGRGMLTAFTLAWARSLGEFGPVLVFVGNTRLKTEVLPSSVYLLWQVGDLHGAAAVSLLMIVISLLVLLAVRWLA